MAPTTQIVRELKLHSRIVQLQVDGLTHTDSLRQPPFRGNCLNWVLGHIVHSRQAMLKTVGLALPWREEDYDQYSRDSDPITGHSTALPLDKILADLAASQETLLARLAEMTEQELDAIAGDDGRTVADRLNFLSWHETYHVGQTEFLRQLAGKDDKVI